jgi:hypothetical protein
MKLKNFASLAFLGLLTSASAFAYSGAAVIVYNPSSNQWGSYRADNRYDAEVGALNEAGIGGVAATDLEAGSTGLVETWATNGWVALAIDGNGNYGTGGLHDSQADAEQSALGNCGNSACYIVRSTSSYVNFPDAP